jgi:hypothetical protein
MTGFRIELIRAAAVTGAVLICWQMALAQEVPSRTAIGPPLPLGGGPASSAPAVAVRSIESSNSTPPGVRVRSLGSVDGPPIGLLDSTSGGLGTDIWQDVPRSRAEDMLKRLPLASAIPSVRALTRRLVLTTADAPAGEAPHAFLSVRLHALLDAGLLEDAGNLAAKAVPKDDPELARLVADSILFAGHGGDACGPATKMRLDSAERFWVELRAYCYAAAGDAGALDLTRAVMQAQKLDSRVFDILLDDVQAHHANVPARISKPDSLEVFLLQSVGFPIEAAWSQQLAMPVSVLAMRDAKNSPEQRLEAAEDVARAGAATPAELAVIADAQAFTPEQTSGAASIAPTLPFLAGQALLRRAVRDAADPAVKKERLFEALSLAYRKNLLPLAAQLQGSAASAVKPQREDRDRAMTMASALMLSGHAEAAARWYDVLDLNSSADLPLVHLLQVELNLVAPSPARTFEAQDALSWFAAQANAPAAGDDTLSSAFLALGIYDALGLASPPEANSALALLKSRQWTGREPGADVLARVSAARADSGRRGDALLSTLDFIGSDGPGDVAPDAIVVFVKVLADMGYTEAAHALAADALLLRRAPAPQSASAS